MMTFEEAFIITKKVRGCTYRSGYSCSLTGDCEKCLYYYGNDDLEEALIVLGEYVDKNYPEPTGNKVDSFIYKLGELLLNEQFGWCYTCDNPMKNITIDGVNNGCDGCCSHKKQWTSQEFLKALYDEYKREEYKKLWCKKDV